MLITLPDTQVEALWFLLRNLQVPRNDFKRHIAWSDRLDDVVTESPKSVGFAPWSGEVESADLEFAHELCAQVEKFPGAMVKAFAALEANLATWRSAIDTEVAA